MSERTSYEPGTPCWIDLGTPDQDAAAEFYGALFGWSVVADENAEETGGYRVATLREKGIGGVMKTMEEGQPPAWSTYIAVADADATAAKAKEAGGEVMFEPMDVLDYGRMAFIVDPTGAVLGLWQPGKNIGAGLVNEPGALSWNELNTRDPEAAKRFYGAVFGWDFDDEYRGEGPGYTTILLGGNPVGGLLDLAAQGVPERFPPTGRSISRSRAPTRPWRPQSSVAAASCSSRSTPRSGASRSSTTPSGRASGWSR